MAVINVSPFMDITALINSDNVAEGDVLLLEEGIYFQTVNIVKDYIRIVAKGPGVIFDGKSSLVTAFTLSDVVGVAIEGINIKHYRGSGILIQSGSGNRIVNNNINYMINNGIEVLASSSNLVWKNEICNCFDGILLISGSTNNWIIKNTVRDCYDDGFEAFLTPDSNNAFISNTAIGNRFNGFDIYGSNNLLLDNSLIDNGLGIVSNQGSNSLAIANKIKGTKSSTWFIFNGYSNYFAARNSVECNRRLGIENNSQFGIFTNNEITYNADTGILLGETSSGNLVMDNKLVCNIPENIDDRGINNNLLNNVDKPCGPCESPSDVCNLCFDEAENSIDGSKEGV